MTLEQSTNIFAPGFKFLEEIKPLSSYSKLVYPAWSPNGDILAFGAGGASDTFWYKELSKLEFRQMEYVGDPIVTWAPDGLQIAISWMIAGIIQVQTLTNLTTKQTESNTFPSYSLELYRGIEGSIKDIKWIPKGKHLITAHDQSCDVIMWNIHTHRAIQRFKARPGLRSISIAISPDGNFLTTNDGNGLLIRKVDNFENIVTEVPGSWSVANVIDWSPDGKFIAVGAFHGSIYIIDTQSWKLIHTLTEPKGQIGDVKFSPQGDFLAVTGEDNIFRLWNCSNWQQKIQFPDLVDGFDQISFHPNKPIMATTAKGKAKLWEYQPYLLH